MRKVEISQDFCGLRPNSSNQNAHEGAERMEEEKTEDKNT